MSGFCAFATLADSVLKLIRAHNDDPMHHFKDKLEIEKRGHDAIHGISEAKTQDKADKIFVDFVD